MKAQDAARAGVTVTDADVEHFIEGLLTQQGKTPAELDTALTGYGLTRADLVAEQHDVVLINSYIGLKVTAGATTDDDRQRLTNDWVIQLQQTSKVDRFGVPDEPIAPRIGASAPDFKLRDMNNKIYGLADLHGHPVLINFWATWCQPCRDELPHIEAAYSSVPPANGATAPGLQVLGVAVGSDPTVIGSFQREFGLTYPLLPDDSGQIQDLYRVGPIPTSFFIDRQGVIRAIEVGALTPESLQADLALVH
jgi:peroxiredoxin